MNKREKKLRWHILMALGITLGVFYSPFLVVNNSGFQKWFLETYRPLKPWQVEFESLRLRPWPLHVRIKNLKLVHPTGHRVSFKTINVKPKIWRLLLRGKLALKQFTLNEPTIILAKTPKLSKKKEGGFKLRTVLLLQNLLLEDAKMKKFSLHFPDGKKLTTELVFIDLSPSLRGGMRLGLDLQKTEFESENKRDAIERLSLNVRTDFSKWSKRLPYAEDIDGTMEVTNARFQKWNFKKLEAELRFEKNLLSLKKFNLQLQDNLLLGKWDCHILDKTFSLELHTSKPVTIPELDDDNRTFNIAGALELDLQLKGKGFNLKTSRGSGSLKATHSFKNHEEFPVQALLDFDWGEGRLHLKNAGVTTDNATLQVTGGLELNPFALGLQFSSKDFPIERFFEKFNDTNLHPIYGQGSLEGAIKGIGKTIDLAVKGEVIEGGYGPLALQKASAYLQITYDQLKLDGTVLSEEKETGKAELLIKYGPRIKETGLRAKTISLNAQFAEHPLETILPLWANAGLLDAQIQLAGPPKQLKGVGNVRVSEGEVFGMAFEEIELPFELTPQNLTLPKITWGLSDENIVVFQAPVVFQFRTGGFLLTGNPIEGLKVEIQYTGSDKKWEIRKFQYKNKEAPDLFADLQGAIFKDRLNLKGKGAVDLKVLSFLNRSIREGEGPIHFDLSATGKFSELTLNGSIRFEKNLLSLRLYPLTMEDLTGSLEFKGNRVETKGLKGLLGSGSFEVMGGFTHEHWSPKSFNLRLAGRQIYFRDKKGTFRMEYDTQLALTGSLPHPSLQGTIIILDGKYTKDFNIIEEIKTAPKPAQEIYQVTQKGMPIDLDLRIRNLGDLTIDNNVGRIDLTADLRVTGSRFNPRMDGNISVAEGEIRYLGLNFDITRGLIEFRDRHTNPYLEIEGEQEIGDAHITARLQGRTDNLRIDLEGNSATSGPLDKKDVISLILFGMTTSERREAAQFQGFELGPTMAAEQIAQALQRPVAKWTKLDILRLETKPTETGQSRQFYLGKKISDRVNVEFSSEVGEEEASQALGLEYLITDFLILKGEKEREENYRMNVGFRIRTR